jgi:hypothetical protein
MDSTDTDSSDDDSQATRRFRGPYLLLVAAFRRSLHALGAFYEWFEERPGWLWLLSGVGAFLFPVYFGDAIRGTLDRVLVTSLTPFLRRLLHLPPRTHLVLFLFAVLSIQSSVTNYRLGNIVDDFNIMATQLRKTMGTDSKRTTDGGQQPTLYGRRSRRVSGALGGAAIGAISGALFGHELEKYALRTSRE